MKRYSLLLLPLVAVVFAVSCRDSTSPAGSHALLAPRNPDLATQGNKPPPPVDAAIEISINSPGSGIFTGVYFSNGKISDVGEPVPTYDGTAWLRLDNKQLTPNVADASPNTRFMVKDNDPPTGMGTFTFLECDLNNVCTPVTYRIVKVDRFIRFNGCGVGDFATSPCAVITFRAENVLGPACDPNDPLNTNGGCHSGHANAFDKGSCLVEDDGEIFLREGCYVSSIL
jgi:hypothetical protein